MDGFGTLTLTLPSAASAQTSSVKSLAPYGCPHQAGFAYTPVSIPSILMMSRSNDHFRPCLFPVTNTTAKFCYHLSQLNRFYLSARSWCSAIYGRGQIPFCSITAATKFDRNCFLPLLIDVGLTTAISTISPKKFQSSSGSTIYILRVWEICSNLQLSTLQSNILTREMMV
jgi:hypothetical protein